MNSCQRSIIHININNFAVEVERVCDPSLRDRPVIVAPLFSSRAPVFDMSSEAYAEGVQKGMTLGRARSLCRGAVVVGFRADVNGRALRAIFERVRTFSPLIEIPDNKGHIFADVTGCRRLFGTPEDIACKIRRMVHADLRLNPSWAIASNKLVAKAAARSVRPEGECIVEAGFEASFLAPLPVGLLPSLGTLDLAALSEFHLRFIGQAARLSSGQLAVVLGERAKVVYDSLRGVDCSPVLPGQHRQERAENYEHIFPTPVNDRHQLEKTLFCLAGKAGQWLRARGLSARRIGVFLEYKDGPQMVRQAGSRNGCCYDTDIFVLALQAFLLAGKRPAGVTRLVLRLDRFTKTSAQQSLFPWEEKKRRSQKMIFEALDNIRVRCGDRSIFFGKGMH